MMADGLWIMDDEEDDDDDGWMGWRDGRIDGWKMMLVIIISSFVNYNI